MSEQDVRQVSALTGTFLTLKEASEKAPVGNERAQSGKELPAASKSDMESIARELNAARLTIGRDLRFEVNVDSGRSVIQVLDRETGEIIRQIPPEDAKPYVSGMGEVVLRLYDDEV